MGNAATTPSPPPTFISSAREPLLSLFDRMVAEEAAVPVDEAGSPPPSPSPSPSFSLSSTTSLPSRSRSRSRREPSSAGRVYRGSLPARLLRRGPEEASPDTCAVEVAVKRLRLGQEPGGRDCYWNEVRVLSDVKHRNLIQLLGCCTEHGEALLVYEFMPRGNLRDALFTTKWGPNLLLPFNVRVKIALDIANGLLCLHENRIIHRDLRPANVLLDEDYTAKITGLGFAKLPDAMKKKPTLGPFIIGRIGYICPAYLETGHVTFKTDLFAYGVILLQLLAGRMTLPDSRSGEEVSLVEIIEQPELKIVPFDMETTDQHSTEAKKTFDENLALKKQIEDLQARFAEEKKEMVKAASSAATTAATIPTEMGDGRNQDTAHVPLALFLSSVSGSVQNLVRTGCENELSRGDNVVKYISSFREFMDPMLGGDYDEDVARRIAVLGARCVQAVPSLRPKIEEAVEIMEQALEVLSQEQ